MSMSIPTFAILGHRGVRGHAPENTLVSFARAAQYHANMAELDIHLSLDRELIVMHDPLVDRTTNGTGLICEKTLKEIKELDAGSWYGPEFKGETVPTLQEVIDLLKGRLPINIEVKGNGTVLYPGIIDLMIETIEKNNLADSVVISSFHKDYVLEVRKKAPYLQAALLYSKPIVNAWEEAAEYGYHLHAKYTLVDEQLVGKAHESGLVVRAWNPNEAEDMRAMIALGVDGIATDYPEVLYDILQENKDK